MSEPPAAPCAVRGLRWGRITDMVCLQHMLLYSLWMGEAHTPLACVAHALAQWHTNERVPFLLQRLCTPTQLRAKYQGSAHERIMTLLQNENTDITDNEEEKAMRAAVQQGPLAQVASDEAGREGHVRAFLAAMYRRDVEMHLLLLCALWPHVPEHRAPEPSRVHTHDTQSKSKRKAARTQRWQGFPTPFAWNALPPAPAPSSVTEVWEIRADQPSLSALFEAYADQLCLLQLSAKLSSSGKMFGSDARISTPNDDRDEAQWFCADVVERYFDHVAPRMCATLRSKCFAPGPSHTPTRRRPWKRSVSSAKPAAPPSQTSTQDVHPILHAERTTRRSSLSNSTRISNEVVMSRRLSRPVSLQRTSSAPLYAASTARTALVHGSKRQKTHASETRAPAKTLVSATPERSHTEPTERPSSPNSSPPTSPTSHRGDPLGSSTTELVRSPPPALSHPGSPSEDRASFSRGLSRSQSMVEERPAPTMPPASRATDADADDSDVELVIPSSRKAALCIDPLSYIG